MTSNAPGVVEPIARLPRVRLRPDQLDALRDAKYDFQSKLRRDLREEDLLQRFFDEEFSEWLKRGLAEPKEKASQRR